MTQEHPINPSPELYKKWEAMPRSVAFEAAYRAGADHELEACCEWLVANDWKAVHKHLRAARRPKPPGLKAQALGALYAIATGADDTREFHQDLQTIKQALESLPD